MKVWICMHLLYAVIETKTAEKPIKDFLSAWQMFGKFLCYFNRMTNPKHRLRKILRHVLGKQKKNDLDLNSHGDVVFALYKFAASEILSLGNHFQFLPFPSRPVPFQILHQFSDETSNHEMQDTNFYQLHSSWCWEIIADVMQPLSSEHLWKAYAFISSATLLLLNESLM